MPGTRGWRLGLYVLRRLLWMVPVLGFVAAITFVLMHFAPGSPWDRAGRQLSPAVVADLNARYGLDQPLWRQLATYLWNAVHFDFGDSYQYQGQTVASLLLSAWPVTLALGAVSFVVVIVVGVFLGTIAALRRNTWVDFLALAVGTLGASVPNFVVGIVLVIALAVGLNRLTQGGWYLPTGGFGLDQHLVLPVLTLSLLPTAYLTRLTRASTLETLRQDYVRTAWSKGLRARMVVLRHVLRNALMPVVTALGPVFVTLVTGSFVVESVFSLPGIGRSYVNAIDSRDYPMILATTLLYAFLIAAANLVVDVGYRFIDPRVRL